MKLLEFWEEISLMPDAVRQLEKLEITEGEYEKAAGVISQRCEFVL